jgi:hypothetical protein
MGGMPRVSRGNQFTAECAEIAEKDWEKGLTTLCALCDLCGKLFARPLRLVLVEVLAGYVVLWNFVSAYFFLVGVAGLFHSADRFGFEGVAFLEKFVDAFGIGAFDVRQALQVSRLAAGTSA